MSTKDTDESPSSGAGEGGPVPKVAVKRFMTLTDVGEELNISSSQTYALVRSGELPAIQIGGRGIWRVERSKVEEYISAQYVRAEAGRAEFDDVETAEE